MRADVAFHMGPPKREVAVSGTVVSAFGSGLPESGCLSGSLPSGFHLLSRELSGKAAFMDSSANTDAAGDKAYGESSGLLAGLRRPRGSASKREADHGQARCSRLGLRECRTVAVGSVVTRLVQPGQGRNRSSQHHEVGSCSVASYCGHRRAHQPTHSML